MIRLAKQRGIDVVLIAVPKPGLFPSPPDFYADIAKEFGLPYEDAALKAILRDNELKSDLAHPNARGYARLAEAIAALLKKRRLVIPPAQRSARFIQVGAKIAARFNQEARHVRSDRQSRADHRLDQGHRQVHRRGDGESGRQGGDLQPQGRGLRGSDPGAHRQRLRGDLVALQHRA